MNERIKKLRKALGLTQQEFAEKIGVKRNTVAQYEIGRNEPIDAVFTLICKTYNVNEDWLRSGVGSMFVEKARDQQIKDFVDSAMRGESTSFKCRLLSVLSRLNEQEWAVLEQKLRELLAEAPPVQAPGDRPVETVAVAELEQKPEADPKDRKIVEFPKAKKRNGMVEITVFDQPATAGLGNYLEGVDSHKENYPDYIIPDGTDFGIIISGDSMEPRVHAGGTAFVQATPVIDEGKIGIFLLNGEAYCKQFQVDRSTHQIHLVSLNPKYQDIVVRLADHFRVLGRVLGQWTRGQEQQRYGW